MRQVTIYTTDKSYNDFIDLTKNLPYVTKLETDEDPKGVLSIIKAGLKEVVEFKKRDTKTTPAKDFLNELQY